MKCTSSFIILFFIANNLFAQLWWASINGETEFCPGDDRTGIIYNLDDNFTTTITFNISCTRCEMRILNSTNPWLTSITGAGPPNFTQIEVNWDSGNFDDAKLRYEIYGHWTIFRDKLGVDEHDIKLVDSSVNPSISSSVSSISCGSASPITFSANWKNANSYSWDIEGGAISGCSTCSTITVIPSRSSPRVKAKVKGYNAACGVYSPEVEKIVSKTIPAVSAISGPDEICNGAPSVLNHSVYPHITGASYNWEYQSTGYDAIPGTGPSNVTIKGLSAGSKQIKLLITACDVPIVKTKYVTSSSSAPSVDLTEDPEEACAGDCIDMQMEAYIGYAAGYQYRYNYGFWQTVGSNGSFDLCTSSGDVGWNDLELKGMGVCGNYGNVTNVQILLNNCFYFMMMDISAEDSLAMTAMAAETEDVILYPNPATTYMNVSLPGEITSSEIAIINDKYEIITSFKSSRKLFAVDATKLVPGYYYFMVANEDQKTSKRFLVQ